MQYRAQGSDDMHTMTIPSDGTETTISELLPNTVYEMHVAAVNGAGEGTNSKPIEGSYMHVYDTRTCRMYYNPF